MKVKHKAHQSAFAPKHSSPHKAGRAPKTPGALSGYGKGQGHSAGSYRMPGMVAHTRAVK